MHSSAKESEAVEHDGYFARVRLMGMFDGYVVVVVVAFSAAYVCAWLSLFVWVLAWHIDGFTVVVRGLHRIP